jgi:hypothetical protein
MLEKPAGLYSRFYTEILRFGSCFGSSLDLLELGFLRASLRDRQTDRQTGRQRQTEGLEIRLWFWRFHPQRLDDCEPLSLPQYPSAAAAASILQIEPEPKASRIPLALISIVCTM